MKAVELGLKTSAWEVFWLVAHGFGQVIHFSRGRSPSIHNGQCCPEGECPLWTEVQQSHGGVEVQLGHLCWWCLGQMFHWLVLPSHALECPCRRIRARDLCFLFSSKAVSCFTGWDIETADYGSAQGGNRKRDEEIQERISTCLEILVQPKHECQHYLLCQPNTEIQK